MDLVVHLMLESGRQIRALFLKIILNCGGCPILSTECQGTATYQRYVEEIIQM